MVFDRYPVTPPTVGTFATHALRNNAKGTDLDKEALERFKVCEICEGWESYRDAAEWESYRSMFFDDVYIATSWKQGNIDEFIQASKHGFAEGSSFMYIMHRICGFFVRVNPELTRAMCKMKVTITCRFTFDGVEMDNESDCRFFFLLEKASRPLGTFHNPEEEVDKFPSGYRYLAWAEVKIGHLPKLNLNSPSPERDILYGKCKDWLEGKRIVPDLTGPDMPRSKL